MSRFSPKETSPVEAKRQSQDPGVSSDCAPAPTVLGKAAGRQPRGKRPSHLLCRLIAGGEQDPPHRPASGPTREEKRTAHFQDLQCLLSSLWRRQRGGQGRRLSAAIRGPGPVGAAFGLDRFPAACSGKARGRLEAGQRDKQQAVGTRAPALTAHERGSAGAGPPGP